MDRYPVSRISGTAHLAQHYAPPSLPITMYVSCDISDEDLIDVVVRWVDILAEERYEDFFRQFGYSMGGEAASHTWIKSDISRYRSTRYFPGESEIKVSRSSETAGGNPTPRRIVEWYKSNDVGLIGAVSYSMPINGRWSDLDADFVLFDNAKDDRYLLVLEEIVVPDVCE